MVHYNNCFSFFQCIRNMYCSLYIAEKNLHSDFDLEIWSWCVVLKIWPLQESYFLWYEDAKSIIKSICASISSGWFYFLPVNTLQNKENAKTARVITPPNTRLPSLNFQNIFRMCYSTFSLLWSVYKYALFLVEREKTTKSPFKGKTPRAITLWVLNQFSQKLQGRRSSSRWLFFLLSVYTKYVLFVVYCRKTTNFDFDLESWSLYKKVSQF